MGKFNYTRSPLLSGRNSGTRASQAELANRERPAPLTNFAFALYHHHHHHGSLSRPASSALYLILLKSVEKSRSTGQMEKRLPEAPLSLWS